MIITQQARRIAVNVYYLDQKIGIATELIYLQPSLNYNFSPTTDSSQSISIALLFWALVNRNNGQSLSDEI